MDRSDGQVDGSSGAARAGRASAGHVTARALPALAADARRALVGAGAAVAAVAALLAVTLPAGPGGLGLDVLVRALALYAAGAWLVWRGLVSISAPHPFGRFGAANRVTLGRMAVVALLGGLVGEPALADGGPDAARWTVIVVATVSALLDAVDGALARRSGLASAFGARFDMETDAALTIVLAALVLHAGQTGAWVLAIGLMRYAFVAASAVWPWLAAPLAPSRRRQAICVVTITALIAALGPIVPAALAAALAGAALVLLSLSFAVDVRVLARARRASTETSR
ncbi:MAG: CDP-alcohol phosphatidyltransferase family protein [Rubrivivax sp.]